MFNAELISLSGDLSYKHVRILDPEDFEKYGVFNYFGEWGCAFLADGKLYITHQYQINLIQLDKKNRTTQHKVDEIIISSEMRYVNACVIPCNEWKEKGIPGFFAGHEHLTEQFVFSNHEGTFITLGSNVVSIISSKQMRPIMTTQPKCETINTQSVVDCIKTLRIRRPKDGL